MPILIKMIIETPSVLPCTTGGCVQVDVTSQGVLVERVGLSPHIALALGKALQAQAVAMMTAKRPEAAVLKPRQRKADG